MSLSLVSRRGLVALAAAILLSSGVLPVATPRPVAAAVLAAPTLTSPGSGSTVTGNPVFGWDAVAGAVSYRIEISASPSFTPVVVGDETQNLRYTPTMELPLGTLYWRVAARDAGNTLGVYAPDSFVKEWATHPNPLTPANDAVLTFPSDPLLFSWSAQAGAQSYELQIDDADDFIGAITYATKNTSYVITEPRTYGQTFYWRVRGVAGTVYSEWSDPRDFSAVWPSVPVLRHPADGSSATEVYFDWDPVPGAKTYQLQVSPNGDWANNTVVDLEVKSTRYAPPSTLNNGSYFWRVRAIDAASIKDYGPWSAEWVFARSWLARPALVEPVDGGLVSVPTFSWEPIAHAAYYELQWSTDPNFLEENIAGKCYTNHTLVTPYKRSVGGGEPGGCTLDPSAGMTYYWRVRGIDPPVANPGAGEPGVLGLWSNTSDVDVWSFVYLPEMPAPLAPADGAAVEAPSFSWSDADGATRYKVTVVSAGGQVKATASTYSTSWAPTAALNPVDGPFRWYVQAYDYADHLGLVPAQGTWWSFTLTAPAATYPAPDQIAPAEGASGYDMPALAWQPVTGASYYQVWYSTNDIAYSSLGTNIHNTAFTYANSVLPSGTYYWYVTAYTGAGAYIADSTGVRTFVISEPDLLSPGDYVAPDKCLPGGGCDQLADTPTLAWNAVPGAFWYRVYLAIDPNFTDIYRTYDTTATELTPRESYVDNQANQAYYWFVRPIRSNNTGRYDSEAQRNASAFQKRSESINRTAPADGSQPADDFTFEWEDYLATNQGLAPAVDQEARQYRITVSQAADFTSQLDQKTIDQPFFTPYDRTYPEGPIYWRVQATDGSSNYLTVSSAGSVTKRSPRVNLMAPDDGSTVLGVPTLQWDPQDYAATYDVQIDNNSNFATPIVTASTKMSAWAYTDSLAAGTYYWRVRRRDADNRDGPWTWDGDPTLPRSFTLQPAEPTLLSPTNASNPNPATLLLQWTSAQPTPWYKVEVSTSSDFSAIVSGYPVTTVMTAWAPKTVLGNGTYFWRVKALNASKNELSTSSVWSFTIDSSRPSVIALSPPSGAAITSTFTVTFSEPVTGVDDTSFVITTAVPSSVVPGTVTVLSPTQARFTPAALLMPGQTYAVGLSTAIIDAVGNPLLPYAANVRATTTVQNDSPAINEAWNRWSTTSASGGAMKMARTASAKLTFTFTGTDVSLVGYQGTSGGYASVYLDGVLLTSSLSFYRSSSRYRATLLTRTGLAAGQHVLDIVPRGTKPSASKDTWVYVDAFVVGATTYQDSDIAVTQRWRRASTSSASGGSYDAISNVKATGRSGATATLQFKGTGVSWYGTKGKYSGIAYVYIDNVKKATVDLYRSSTAYRQKLWTSATLSNGIHTIKILVYGTRRSGAKGYDVSIDYFTIK